MKFHLGDAFDWLLCGKYRNLWPDFSCTRNTSPKTRTACRWWRKGKSVTPLEHYSFHTNFDVKTDGKQWVLRCASGYIANRATAEVLFLFGLAMFIFGIWPMEGGGPPVLVYPAIPILIAAFYLILKVRTGGEDIWIVLDRTTGNVCFWKRKAKKSLTVPFDQVKCYWLTKSLRGGVSHHLCLMPEVSLPNERNRHWEVMMGSTPMYEQAQYFWRVINDFMDASQPIPEVDGLIHQVRSMEKLGYSLEDITHGGKEVPIKEWEEVEKELRNDAQALKARLDRLFEPKHFNAQAIYDLYNQVPVYFKKEVLIEVKDYFELVVSIFENRNAMAPGYSEHFTKEEYRSEVSKLGQLMAGTPHPDDFTG